MRDLLSRIPLIIFAVAFGCVQEITADGRYKQGKMEKEEGRKRYHRKRDREEAESHVHKWKGHKERRGEKGEGWKKKWHGGRGFTKHASHMWHKYGWFWDEEAKSWYQCTPIEDPKRGYGCEYEGKWYPMVKEKEKARGTTATRTSGTMKVVTEEPSDEDLVELEEEDESMPMEID